MVTGGDAGIEGARSPACRAASVAAHGRHAVVAMGLGRRVSGRSRVPGPAGKGAADDLVAAAAVPRFRRPVARGPTRDDRCAAVIM